MHYVYDNPIHFSTGQKEPHIGHSGNSSLSSVHISVSTYHGNRSLHVVLQLISWHHYGFRVVVILLSTDLSQIRSP